MSNIYSSVLEVLRRDGWAKGGRGGHGAPRCLIGAFDEVCGHFVDYHDHLLEPLNEFARSLGFHDSSDWPAAIWMNDDANTDFGMIEIALEKAAG